MLLPPWSNHAGCLLATGYTEVRDQQFVAALADAGDYLVDVGANLGLYGVTAGYHGVRVAAFEPNSRAASIAELNLARNGITEEVHRLALADWDGTTQLTDEDVTAHIGPAGPLTVEVARLDSLMLVPTGLPIMKIDAEGQDLNVLRGAARFLGEHRPVVLAEIWDGGREIRDLLAGMGYTTFSYDWRTRRLETESAQQAGNLLAIHPSRLDEVFARLNA